MVRDYEPRPLPLDDPAESFADIFRSPEILLAWPIPDIKALGLRYPLRATPDMGDPNSGPYLDLRIEIADDYVDRASERIEPIATTLCRCGSELSYDPTDDDQIFYAGRIKRRCPSCGVEFRPQDHATIRRDCATGVESTLMGGAVSRFAIVIDCGKAFEFEKTAAPDGSVKEMEARATPEFLAVCESALGIELYEVGEGY
jgi:hypothetical protein